MENFDQLIYRLRHPSGIGEPSDHDAMQDAAIKIEAVCEAGENVLAWLDGWAMHVGKCPGYEQCTCGLTAMRAELHRALRQTG